MNNEEATAAIMKILLALDTTDRRKVFDHVTYNDIFCVHCGGGEITSPNPNCCCSNDE